MKPNKALDSFLTMSNGSDINLRKSVALLYVTKKRGNGIITHL